MAHDLSSPGPGGRAGAQPWALVLAGGEGVRLRPLVRLVCGDERPKQYVPLLGIRSLLRQTLDRTHLLIPPTRTIVVSQRRHGRYLAQQGFDPRLAVLLQPDNRDTALGILYPAHWLAWRDPDATLVVVPSDHFVREEAAFMAHVAGVLAFVERDPDWLVLLGAHPTEPDPDYGWIEPGEELSRAGPGGIFRAGRFREKPAAHVAAHLLARGWLWNTFVFAAKVGTIIAAGRELLPDVHDRLVRLAAVAGTPREARVLERVYADTPRCNFSVSILQAGLPNLAVSELSSVLWSDLGSPRRVLRLLQQLRLSPPWVGRVASAVRRDTPATAARDVAVR
jgi:mannose-1-phosphate guanylyltransferase